MDGLSIKTLHNPTHTNEFGDLIVRGGEAT